MLCNSDKSSNMSVEYIEQSAQKLWRMAPALHCTALDKKEGKKDDRWSQVLKHHLNFKKERFTLSRDSVTRFFASGSFHESVSPQPQSIPSRPFRIFSKIRGDIRS